jgi:hypothetical protein
VVSIFQAKVNASVLSLPNSIYPSHSATKNKSHDCHHDCFFLLLFSSSHLFSPSIHLNRLKIDWTTDRQYSRPTLYRLPTTECGYMTHMPRDVSV